ncbi:aspartate/glutamate racemase family protein [Polaromonas sp.]|jgi:hypothetical protein|uniref:aspartate/glutamate racemase family protein n=1 Tax=Polaromonas sp. TaxID=1869339 RepID=UPI00351F9B73
MRQLLIINPNTSAGSGAYHHSLLWRPLYCPCEAGFAVAGHAVLDAWTPGRPRWKPIQERLAHLLGHGAALGGIPTVAPTGAQLAQACRQATGEFRAQAIILGGAGLAGMAAVIQPHVDVPVIDSVLAGTRQALLQAAMNQSGATDGFDVRWQQLSPELIALGSVGV